MTIEEVIKSSVPMSPQKRVVLNIGYTQNKLAEGIQSVLKPFDISAEQFNVLRILRGQKGKPANMSLIQERMLAKTSNTTRLVDKLLAKELVTRKICPSNRRKMEIGITSKGLELLSELDPVIVTHEHAYGQKMSVEELEQLSALLDKFRNL
ncbi:MarR family winged helix-turn-helix transcriptional regulator [Flavobacterium selenitireducens]|uniref:MarR family winged helix-turn-helix transcriptional regulator n=1 Tax=Flavobacterium selenitireducens TaxID=2722704 RepID=UPI00168A5B01|nr:MarR family transcriptional regulator [Flavobacterium selenitireducens]MBD3583829.1 MarR family transcriptional regulator [Flavobacterium selenitireducens]